MAEYSIGFNKSLSHNLDSKMTLVRIEYDKGIYNPGKVVLTFHMNDSNSVSDTTLKSYFYTSTNNNSFKVWFNNENNQIVSGYRLFSIKRTSKSSTDSRGGISTTWILILTLYSPEYMWTKTPGNNAWTGKTLGEIISKQATKDSIAYAGATDILTFLKNGKSENNTTELPQSYLVQYNESFYDFISRTANRCGEFLFWEAGSLHYGLPEAIPADSKTVTNVLNSENKKKVINREFLCADSTTMSDSSALCNIGDDDSYKSYSEFESHKPNPIGAWIATCAVQDALQADSFVKMFGNLADSLVSNFAGSIGAKLALNSEMGKYSGDSDTKSYSKTTGIKDVYESDATFKTYLNKFYHEIGRLEKLKTDEKIEIDYLQTTPSHQLGDFLKINSSDTAIYTVTRVYGYIDTQDGTTLQSHKEEAIENQTYNDKSFGYGKGNNFKNIASIAVPPLGPRPHIRTAEPMEAVVQNNDDPDFNGRVRVKFLWQGGNSDATPWLRVCTPYVGADDKAGFVMTPENESHVILNFMYNNIEMPYVSAAICHDGNRSTRGYTDTGGCYIIPSYQVQTISSSNGAGLTFMDSKNDVNFFNGLIPLVPQLWNLIVAGINKKANDPNKNKSNKWKAGLNSAITLRDRNGIVSIDMNSAARSIQINSGFGKVNINAYTGITISAPNGDVNIVGKNVNITAGNNLSLKSGANIHDNKMGESVGTTLAGCFAKLPAEIAKVAMKETLGTNVTKLCDISFIRAVIETFARPIEGTLSVSSKRNVAITAGNGAAVAPASTFGDPQNDKNKYAKFRNEQENKIVPLFSELQTACDLFQRLKQGVNENITTINVSVRKLKQAFTDQSNSIWGYKAEIIAGGNTYTETIKNIVNAETLDKGKLYDFCIDYALKKEDQRQIPDKEIAGQEGENNIEEGQLPPNPHLTEVKNALQAIVSALVTCKNGISGVINEWTLDKDISITWNKPVAGQGQQLSAENQQIANNFTEASINSLKTNKVKLKELVLETNTLNFNSSIQTAVGDILRQSLGEALTFTIQDASNWTDFVEGIKLKDKSRINKYVVSALDNFAKSAIGFDLAEYQKLGNYNYIEGARAMWAVGNGDGNVMISNSGASTLMLDKDSTQWKKRSVPGLAALKKALYDIVDSNRVIDWNQLTAQGDNRTVDIPYPKEKMNDIITRVNQLKNQANLADAADIANIL